MREMYCLGDYVSQIGSRVRKCKKKPDKNRNNHIQKYMGVNVRKCLVNNVHIVHIDFITVRQDYVSIVCGSKAEAEQMQRLCQWFNKIGDVTVRYMEVAGRITLKFEAVKFLQISMVLSEKRGVDLRNKVHVIAPLSIS